MVLKTDSLKPQDSNLPAKPHAISNQVLLINLLMKLQKTPFRQHKFSYFEYNRETTFFRISLSWKALDACSSWFSFEISLF